MGSEKAATHVAGGRAITNDIEVKLGTRELRSDQELAQAAALVLKSSISVPAEDIKAVIDDGWITLEGKVAFKYSATQRRKRCGICGA
ncbi:MAG: BON domain-containing protein [Steroidobacteraceae bacterium]